MHAPPSCSRCSPPQGALHMGRGAISSCLMFFMGEVTSPILNAFTISRELRHRSKLAFRVFAVASPAFTGKHRTGWASLPGCRCMAWWLGCASLRVPGPRPYGLQTVWQLQHRRVCSGSQHGHQNRAVQPFPRHVHSALRDALGEPHACRSTRPPSCSSWCAVSYIFVRSILAPPLVGWFVYTLWFRTPGIPPLWRIPMGACVALGILASQVGGPGAGDRARGVGTGEEECA